MHHMHQTTYALCTHPHCNVCARAERDIPERYDSVVDAFGVCYVQKAHHTTHLWLLRSMLLLMMMMMWWWSIKYT